MSQQTEYTNASNTMNHAMEMETPRIYVASLSDYNNGFLHGAWIDASKGYDYAMDKINEMLAESPAARKYGDIAEEYAIHDFENFMGIELSEYSGIEGVCELAEALEEHGEAFAVYYEHCGYSSVENALEAYQDAFCGIYESEEAYAQELADEMMPHDASSFLTQYFDYEAFSRDLFLCDYFSCEISAGYAIFRNV